MINPVPPTEKKNLVFFFADAQGYYRPKASWLNNAIEQLTESLRHPNENWLTFPPDHSECEPEELVALALSICKFGYNKDNGRIIRALESREWEELDGRICSLLSEPPTHEEYITLSALAGLR